MINWIRGFLSARSDLSSKRLTMILSYLVSLALCTVCVVWGIPLESNVLTLLMGCCGVSSGAYVVSNRNEIGKEGKDAA